jgi:hypothetical protein
MSTPSFATILTSGLAVTTALGLAPSLAGCGSSKSTPDAATIKLPDASSCPVASCGGVCVDTTTDKQHCGSCTNACTQTGSTCGGTPAACGCPAAFLPASHTDAGSDLVTAFGGATLAIGLESAANGTNGVVIGYDPATIQTAHAYDLSTVTAGTRPYVQAAYGFDLMTFIPSAAFYATAGTLTFTKACANGVVGTLTGATFKASTNVSNPMIDLAGCGFTMPTVTFTIGACP